VDLFGANLNRIKNKPFFSIEFPTRNNYFDLAADVDGTVLTYLALGFSWVSSRKSRECCGGNHVKACTALLSNVSMRLSNHHPASIKPRHKYGYRFRVR